MGTPLAFLGSHRFSVSRQWIPHGPGHIMCDGLLKIASLVIEDESTRAFLEATGVDLSSDFVDLRGSALIVLARYSRVRHL